MGPRERDNSNFIYRCKQTTVVPYGRRMVMYFGAVVLYNEFLNVISMGCPVRRPRVGIPDAWGKYIGMITMK